MHSSRMRTARLLTVSCSARGGGEQGIYPHPPLMQTPLDAHPSWMHTPFDVDPTGCTHPGHVTCDACWEATPTPVNRMTHSCKNITLLQTSFAGGNKQQASSIMQIFYTKWMQTQGYVDYFCRRYELNLCLRIDKQNCNLRHC